MTNLVAFGVVLALCLVAVWAAPSRDQCPECPNRNGPEVCAVDKDGNSKNFENKCSMDSANCRDSKIGFMVKSTGRCPEDSKKARARLARALQSIVPTNTKPRTLSFQLPDTEMDLPYDGSGGNRPSMKNGVPLEEKALGGPGGIMPVDGDYYGMPEETEGDMPDGTGFDMPDMGKPQADMPPSPEDGLPLYVNDDPAPEPEKKEETHGDASGDDQEDQDDEGRGKDDEGKGRERDDKGRGKGDKGKGKGDKGKGKGDKGKGEGDKGKGKGDKGKGREEKGQDKNEISRGDRENERFDNKAPERNNFQNLKPAEGNQKNQPKLKEEKKDDMKSGKEQKKADKLQRKEQKKADKLQRKEQKKADKLQRKEQKKGDKKERKEEKEDKKSERKK